MLKISEIIKFRSVNFQTAFLGHNSSGVLPQSAAQQQVLFLLHVITSVKWQQKWKIINHEHSSLSSHSLAFTQMLIEQDSKFIAQSKILDQVSVQQ